MVVAANTATANTAAAAAAATIMTKTSRTSDDSDDGIELSKGFVTGDGAAAVVAPALNRSHVRGPARAQARTQ